MKVFKTGLLEFCLLMCSCKSTDKTSEVSVSARYLGATEYARYSALADTSSGLRIEMDKSKMKIVETLKITEYDAESGNPVKETEAKREIVSDNNKALEAVEERGQSEVRNDSLNQFREVTKMMESKVKEESDGGQEAFGKWFGIVLGLGIIVLFVYLLRKFRVN